MILVTGTFTARQDAFAEAKEAALAHVHRSRAEPGCLSHDVAVDAECAERLVFVERWVDMDALRVHFAVPATRGFGKLLQTLAAEPGTLRIYQAEEARP